MMHTKHIKGLFWKNFREKKKKFFTFALF